MPHRYANLTNCDNCTGDYLINSKDSQNCYNYWGLQNCKWMTNGDGAKDTYDCYSTGGPELCYYSMTPDNSFAAVFTVYCWRSQFILYSDNCHASKSLFGCVGMRQNEHCILNRQYSPEEYEKMLPKITEYMKKTGEWGQFFRPDVAPFAYNETPAEQFYSLNQSEAEAKGYRFQEVLPGSFSKETVQWKEVPDSINGFQPDGSFGEEKKVSKEIFPCQSCGKNFKILEKELHFYRNNNIPLPRLCVDCRFIRRFDLMNSRKLHDRKCDKCGVSIKTTYAPEREETVYCEGCYLELLN